MDLTNEELQVLADKLAQPFLAALAKAKSDAPFRLVPITIALDTAQTIQNPKPISFPFTSVMVTAVTDQTVQINLRPDTQDSFQGDFPLGQKDVVSFDQPVTRAFLSWSAQPGKSITLLFGVGIDFKSGTLVSVQSGGVNVSDGSAISAATKTTLSAGVAAAIAPQNLSRKCATLQNKTGASIFIAGDATVTDDTGAVPGIEYGPGERIYHRNTGALYAYSAAGGVVALVEET